PNRSILYIATSGGIVERFNALSGSMMSPFVLWGSLTGIDVTLDGSFIYVANNTRGATQNFVHKINASTGQVTNLGAPNGCLEGGPHEIAITNNGTAFVVPYSPYMSSSLLWVLDLATDTRSI